MLYYKKFINWGDDMPNITIDNLLEQIKIYNPEELERVKKAYNVAFEAHKGQKRKSGEDFIIHPINVAYILTTMLADGDTICAALLHDCIEDANITKEQIASEFGENVAGLVDGVTKIKGINFKDYENENNANLCKLIEGIKKDIRVLIIKLADRLHNMRTMDSMISRKQFEKSRETLSIYVPLAEKIGAYRIKKELEDLSLKYLNPEAYKNIGLQRVQIYNENFPMINQMCQDTHRVLFNNGYDNKFKFHIKNIYGIYKKTSKGIELNHIHDLIVIKLLLENIDMCYTSLRYIHELYPMMDGYFKDFISRPKTNLYQALHTTVCGLNNHPVQYQIRTEDMDEIASFGMPAHWHKMKGSAANHMQQTMINDIPFYHKLVQLEDLANNEDEYAALVTSEILSSNVYVRTMGGLSVELPKGSTPIDFAYYVCPDVADYIDKAYVNGKEVPLTYKLQYEDRVEIVTREGYKNFDENLINSVKTGYARTRMKKLNSKC